MSEGAISDIKVRSQLVSVLILVLYTLLVLRRDQTDQHLFVSFSQ